MGLAACGAAPDDEDAAESEAALDVHTWKSLRARLAGKLVLPGEAAYPEARLAYNPIFDARHPAAIAVCARPADVQACVDFARRNKVRFAARSGGHSYGGYSTVHHGLVIDLGGMRGVAVAGNGTAVVGAGARLVDVYAGLAADGRCLPAGSCPSVGVSGLTLGGGIGVLARLYGLTCDHLLSAEVVLADGTRRLASATKNPDLFWALRGGGGGNFGVVTSFTFRTPKAPSEISVFELAFPVGTAAAVLAAWQDWLTSPAPPDALWSNCIVSSGSPPHARVGGAFVGSTTALGALVDELTRRVRSAGGGAPLPASSYTTSMGYLEAMRYFAGCSHRTIRQCHLADEGGAGQLARSAFVASSRIVQSPMADTQAIANLLAQHTGVSLLFDSLGGAAGRVAATATAFPHRDAIASVQIVKSTTASASAAARQEVAALRSALEPLCGGGAYVNYIEPGMANWAEASYGANLARLRKVAQTFDPDGVFSFAQAVRAP